MPIWLRKLTFKKLKEWYDTETKSKSKNPNEIDLVNPDKSKLPSQSIPRPRYTTKPIKK